MDALADRECLDDLTRGGVAATKFGKPRRILRTVRKLPRMVDLGALTEANAKRWTESG